LITFAILLGVFVGLMMFAIPVLAGRRAPPRSIAPIETPYIRAAVHEAGHVVAAWSCTFVRNMPEVLVRMEGSGHVQIAYFNIGKPDERWCYLAILLAGAAAEATIFKKGRSAQAASDLRAALAEAKAIGDASPPWKPIETGASIDFVRLFQEPLDPKVLGVLVQGYRMSKRLVLRKRARPFHQTVSMLIASGRASEAQLEKILGSRFVARSVAPLGARFVGLG
jgi:hypothetical protein